MTVFEDKRYAYDSHGNLIDKKIAKHTHITLAWIVEHQLIESQTTTNAQADAPTVQQTNYGYDPFGRRVFKRDAFGETWFVWDGNRMLAETRGSHTRTYLYSDSSFVPLAQIDSDVQRCEAAEKSKGKVLYFHTNHNGTPRELTDGDGNLQWVATYKAWGNVLRVEMAQAQVNTMVSNEQALRFQGQYFDVETGLHYNRFRYYDPAIGRFISQDPIGLSGGNNLYHYAPNLVHWVDPLGLDALQTLADRGFTGVVKNANGGLNYAGSNALFEKPGLNPIQEIFYTGDYLKDFEAANLQALGQKSTPKGAVWHHLDDYDPVTNKGTMQLVKRDAHLGIPHKGGVSQYQASTGKKYTFPCRN